MAAIVMAVLLLAHLSDLHLGRNPRTDDRARALTRMLVDRDVDHVVVSGDITHRGRRHELETFREIFASWIQGRRLSVVPGNHDRLGDDVSAELMGSERVSFAAVPGLFLIRLDTTGLHNRSFIAGHGAITEADLAAVDAALVQAPPDAVVVLVMHHHPLPLPHDNLAERIAAGLGWSSGEELPLGGALTARLRGRCDLVLHGHRHLPSTTILYGDEPRPLALCNAGSSTDLGHVRMFAHRRGRLSGEPVWLTAAALATRPLRELVTGGPVAITAAVGNPAA
jgi:3',5'-cyclic AMP phosphodiesterase CpdA